MADLALERSQLNVEQHDSEKSATQCFETFEDMRLKDKLLKEIKEYGYEKPTAIQQRIIVPLCESKDVLVKVAKSEPGKAPAICIGILQKLDCDLKECQALILTSGIFLSRELGKDMRKLGASLKVNVHVLGDDESTSGTQVLVGDLFYVIPWLWKRGGLSWTKHIKVLVLDNADNYACRSLISQIFTYLLPLRNKDRSGAFSETASHPLQGEYQVCFFSERVPYEVKIFLGKWMHDYDEISLPCTHGEGNVTHQIISVENEGAKPNWLLRLYNNIKTTSVIFVNSPQLVQYLVSILKEQKWENPKWEVLSTNDNMNQKDRDRLKQSLLAEGGPKVLITTDEWAYGIDLKQVALVVNYIWPVVEPDKYLHHMRLFEGADVINFVNTYEWERMLDIQEHYQGKVTFKGTPLQPFGIGPNGFSNSLLQDELLPELSKHINHIVYHVLQPLDPATIWSLLSGVLVKTKSVIFAMDRVDLLEELQRNKFAVFTNDLEGFCECQEDCCTLLITDTYAPNVKAPLVINCDLPSTPGLYDHRIAACGRDGVVIHFATDNDWFKLFCFQNPPESVVNWAPSDDEISDMILKAKSIHNPTAERLLWKPQLFDSSQEPKLQESGLDRVLTEANLPQSSQQPTVGRPLWEPQVPDRSIPLVSKPKMDTDWIKRMMERITGEVYD